MQYAVVNDRWQVTIPADVRNALGIHQKDKMRFEVNGKVVTLSPAQVPMGAKSLVKPAKKVTADDLYGILPKPARAYSVEEMNRSIRGDL